MKSLSLLLALLLSASGCATNRAAYTPPPIEPALASVAQDDRGMYLALLQQMQTQGAYFASLAHIDAFRKRFGDPPELRALQAHALRETGEPEAAASLYRTLTKGPQAAPAWHGLGLVAAGRGDMIAAEKSFESAVQLEPLNSRYLGDLGFVRLKAGLYAQARAPLAKAAELNPDNPRAVSNLALWALLSDRPDTAESIMRQANLPTATRVEIQRLARQLHDSRVTQATTPVAPPLPSLSDAVAEKTTALPAGNRRPAPPDSMLERFASPTSRPNETLP